MYSHRIPEKIVEKLLMLAALLLGGRQARLDSSFTLMAASARPLTGEMLA